MDKDGKALVDTAGNASNRLAASRYRQGMVFRCDPDGTNFELLGHNFRNNYEVAVDSSARSGSRDNDDDGNRGVAHQLRHGGRQLRLQGRDDRRRLAGAPHEHRGRDPAPATGTRTTRASCPNLLHDRRGLADRHLRLRRHAAARRSSGTRSSTATPGPNVVRAYPVQPSGAGYKADVLNILEARQKDNWFRPVDVCVAPDGSLFVADWYDPGVGGHNMSDQTQGRIFRVAPPNTRYTVPALDLSTAAGAARALNSPNHATRYLAYEKLHAMGRGAENVLATMYRGTDARERARALWLLARIPGRGARYLDAASRDADPNIRIVALRATRRIGADVIPIAARLVKDPAPEVRREVAIALRHEQSPRAAALWADLAAQHDGKDRWYLEALGVSADKQWDRYFGAWLDKVGDGWNTPAGRDIVWRARSSRALPLLEKLATDSVHSRRRASPLLPRLRLPSRRSASARAARHPRHSRRQLRRAHAGDPRPARRESRRGERGRAGRAATHAAVDPWHARSTSSSWRGTTHARSSIS